MIGEFFVLIDCLRVLYLPSYFLFDFISWKGRWGSLWLSLDTVSLRTCDLLMDPHSLYVQCDQNNGNLTGLSWKISDLTLCNPPDLIRFNWSSIVHSLEFQILPQIGLSFAFSWSNLMLCFQSFSESCKNMNTPTFSLMFLSVLQWFSQLIERERRRDERGLRERLNKHRALKCVLKIADNLGDQNS